jgi:hypothetical protein
MTASGLGCVKTRTTCDVVECCSQAAAVPSVLREAPLSGSGMQRCRKLEESAVLGYSDARAHVLILHATLCRAVLI